MLFKHVWCRAIIAVVFLCATSIEAISKTDFSHTSSVPTEENFVVTCPNDSVLAVVPPPVLDDFQDFLNTDGTMLTNVGSCAIVETTFTYSDVETCNDCTITVVRSYSFFDDNGVEYTCDRTFTAPDTKGPVFDGATLPIYPDINCEDADGIPPQTMAVSFLDNCSNAILTTPDVPVVEDICNGYVINHLWVATDECGNASQVQRGYTVVPDETPPVFDALPTPMSSIRCDADIPDQEVLTATDNCTDVTITTKITVTEYSPCVANMITYTWTAIDECTNEAEVTLDVTIRPDNIRPMISCEDITVSTDKDQCYATVTLEEPDANDTCGDVTVSTTSSSGQFPIGTSLVTWIATDECLNTRSCVQRITVEDNQEPTIACNGDLSVSLDNNGDAIIYPSQIILETDDNCPGSLDYDIFLMEDICDIPVNETPGPSVQLCCFNIGTVMVVAQVTDQAGNAGTCMVPVTVSDELPPFQIQDLSDVTISCSYAYDLDDLSEFGTFETSTADLNSFLIDDPELGLINLNEGLVGDNCTVSVLEGPPIVDIECDKGTITRTFTLLDDGDNKTDVDQVITIVDVSPFNGEIEWPKDVTITSNEDNCMPTIPGTDVLGSPEYEIAPCSSILYNHDDQPVSVIGPGCQVVERTFSVIDWCQFVPNVTPVVGRWEHTQVITVINETAPVFSDEVCKDLILCGNEQTCTGLINTSIIASDDCTDDIHYSYIIDVMNDGDNTNDITGEGNEIFVEVPYGEHQIYWWADDRCTNVAACSQMVFVQDCKAPTAACLYGLAINLNEMPGVGIMAEIWAKDFDASSFDNCTEYDDLIFTLSVKDANGDYSFFDEFFIFDCGDLGIRDVKVAVEDADGNISFCDTYIVVQDNYDYCPDPLPGPGPETETETETEQRSFSVAGTVSTSNATLLADVSVVLSSDEYAFSTITDVDGRYLFEEVLEDTNFEIEASYNDEAINGLSTFDILLIQKHVLGIEMLDNPYNILAADVNMSNTVSAVDIVELRKIILGLQTDFTEATTWQFFNAESQFADPMNPFNGADNINMSGIDHDVSNMDLVAVKTGDVNNNASLNGLANTDVDTRNANFISWNIQMKERGLIQIAVNNDISLHGFQFAIAPTENAGIISIQSNTIDFGTDNYVFSKGVARLSWSGAETVDLKAGDIVLEVQLNKDAKLNLMSLPYINPEVYDIDNEIKELILQESDKDSEGWTVFNNTPNPFSNETEIPFIAPKEVNATLSVFDVTGKTLFQETKSVAAGYQLWKVDATNFGNVHGVLYYRLESGEFSSTRPFIRLK